jgi:Tol biopolymer transport system component/DNA-binding winged helix-turn-helix (wHTH) protein
MDQKSHSAGRIRFGAFEADLEARELLKEGKRIPLANQSFVALAALLERPGQLVSREELRRRLWPENRVVDFEQGLNAIINRLREALGSAPGGVGLIETLPRRGYRFTGTVQCQEVGEPANPRDEGVRLDRRAAYGFAIVLCLLVASAVVLISRARPDGTPKVEPLTSLSGREVAPALTADGERLLFAWNGDADSGGHFDLYSKQVGSERLLRLTHDSAVALHAAWAPGGAQLALARQTERDSGVYIAPVGGAERLLAPAVFLNEPFMQLSWSPDGRQIAYAAIDSDGWSHIHLAEASGSQRRSLDRPQGCADSGAPAFSSDGRRLGFVCTSSVSVYSVYVMELSTGAVQSLASLQGDPQGLVWTLAGDALIVASELGNESAIWRVTLSGHPTRVLRSEGPLGPGIAAAAGRIAFVRDNPVIDISRADLTSPMTATDNLISSTRTQLVPTYSPDGARIAFESTRSGSSEIWLADADGRNPVKVTSFDGPLTGAPSWCADGRRIAFDSRATGASAIYVLDILEGRPRRLETTVANLALPVWSQDCRWIIASNGRTALYRVPVAGGATEQFTAKRSYRAVVSGLNVIFNVTGEHGVELWSKPVEDGVEIPLEGMPPLQPWDAWTATLRGIYYTSSGSPSISFYDYASHHARVVRPLQGSPAALGGLGISVSKDERWLLYTRAERSEADIMTIPGG